MITGVIKNKIDKIIYIFVRYLSNLLIIDCYLFNKL